MISARWMSRIPLLAGWLVLVAYAYPGVMTMDSFDQLREGRAWFFTDANPPIMAVIWGVLDRIWSGPFLMLVVQGTCFLAGVYLTLRRVMRPMRAAICASCLMLFPPVLAPLAVIWKDCLMAGFLVLGIPLLLSERRALRIVALALFVLATALRYNALGATAPLVVVLFQWRPGQRWVVRYAISAATWLAVVVVAMGVNGLLTDKQLHYWHSSSALADITGVVANVDHDVPDSELGPLLEPTEIKVHAGYQAAMRAKWKPYDFQQILTGDGNLWDVPATEPMPVTRRDAVQHAWTTLVKRYPGAYLRFRLATFGETLGLHRKFQGATVVTHRNQYAGMLDLMHIERHSWRFQEVGESITMWTAKRTRLFRPHLYLALTLILLVFAWRQRDVLAILLSGLAMELTYLPLGWTADYRFSHWLVICTCLAIVMLIARRARPASE